MKAHTDNKDNHIILSIGMIVKNEEKVLERCLKSLQPLMKEVKSELIIADTGSTDSTVEIARKYTDNVFHFDWINDFAAARNATLKKARGIWYFFIDADEYLDSDITEIVHFFQNTEAIFKYKTIEILVRNYTKSNKKEYFDMFLPRFHRNNGDNMMKFIGKIHEAIPIRSPLATFSSPLHHTGYDYKSMNQHLEKRNRNLALMRGEYENNKKDLRILSHLIDGTYFETEEKERYINSALELVREKRNDFYANVIYMQIISHYQNTDPNLSLKLCEEYLNTLDNNEKYVATVAIMLIKGKILSALARYEDAYKSLMKYIELYNEYKKGELILSDESAHPIEGLSRHEFVKYNCLTALCLKKLKRYSEASAILKKLDLNELDEEEFKIITGTIKEICTDSMNYDMLVWCYNKTLDSNDEYKINFMLYTMESIYYSIIGDDRRKEFSQTILKSKIEGKYRELMILLSEQDVPDFQKKLYDFIVNIDNWKEGYSEAIYLAIKHGLDISSVVDKINASEFRSKLETIANNHDDFARYVLNYGVPESYTENIKRFYWVTCMLEKAACRSFELEDDLKYELYLRFTNILGEYVSNIYNQDLLNDEEDVEVLPSLHRFGYYMLKANTQLNIGNHIEYIRGMKKALINCESMKEIVEFMLEQFKKMIGM